jgi:DNA-binding MarR family transcriptional regulator
MNALTNLNPSEFILKANKVKKGLLQIEELTWTDLLVICTVHQLELTSQSATTALVIGELKMNKCWIYKSVRRLESKGFILLSTRPRERSQLFVSNWGKILLQRAGEAIILNS